MLTGRIKNLIVTAAGKKIYPEEIEARLGRSRFVKEVAVVAGRGAQGTQGAGAREEVHAHVVPALDALESCARERGHGLTRVRARTLERRSESLGQRPRCLQAREEGDRARRGAAQDIDRKVRRDALNDEST